MLGRAIRLVACVLTCLFAMPTTAAPPARYDFKQGQTATFDVQIEITDGRNTWLLSGMPIYTVDSVVNGVATITCEGTLTVTPKLIDGKPPEGKVVPPFGEWPGIKQDRKANKVTFRVNERGELLSTLGDSRLPYLIDDLHELVLVRLPGDAVRQWTRETDIQIAVSQSPQRSMRDLLILAQRFGATGSLERVPATETVEYVQDKPDEFKRTCKIVSRDIVVGGSPRIDISTNGTVTLDTGLLAQRVAWSGKFVLRDGLNETGRLITVIAKRMTEKDLADRKIQLAEEAEERKKEHEAARQAAMKAAEEFQKQIIADLDKLVADLKSGDRSRILAAANRLSSITGEVPARPDVADALLDLYKRVAESERSSIGRAFVKWATPRQNDLLIEMLSDKDLWTRRAAIEELGKRHEKKAIPAIAARLNESFDSWTAVEALKQFGSDAEDAVLRQIKMADRQGQHQIYSLISDIGTKKSLPTLEKIAREGQFPHNHHAERAIAAIKLRGK